ncbi:hypothetical protein ACN4EG_04440 [Alkalinema pantanalense CENA528]
MTFQLVSVGVRSKKRSNPRLANWMAGQLRSTQGKIPDLTMAALRGTA